MGFGGGSPINGIDSCCRDHDRCGVTLVMEINAVTKLLQAVLIHMKIKISGVGYRSILTSSLVDGIAKKRDVEINPRFF